MLKKQIYIYKYIQRNRKKKNGIVYKENNKKKFKQKKHLNN